MPKRESYTYDKNLPTEESNDIFFQQYLDGFVPGEVRTLGSYRELKGGVVAKIIELASKDSRFEVITERDDRIELDAEKDKLVDGVEASLRVRIRKIEKKRGGG